MKENFWALEPLRGGSRLSNLLSCITISYMQGRMTLDFKEIWGKAQREEPRTVLTHFQRGGSIKL